MINDTLLKMLNIWAFGGDINRLKTYIVNMIESCKYYTGIIPYNGCIKLIKLIKEIEDDDKWDKLEDEINSIADKEQMIIYGKKDNDKLNYLTDQIMDYSFDLGFDSDDISITVHGNELGINIECEYNKGVLQSVKARSTDNKYEKDITNAIRIINKINQECIPEYQDSLTGLDNVVISYTLWIEYKDKETITKKRLEYQQPLPMYEFTELMIIINRYNIVRKDGKWLGSALDDGWEFHVICNNIEINELEDKDKIPEILNKIKDRNTIGVNYTEVINLSTDNLSSNIIKKEIEKVINNDKMSKYSSIIIKTPVECVNTVYYERLNMKYDSVYKGTVLNFKLNESNMMYACIEDIVYNDRTSVNKVYIEDLYRIEQDNIKTGHSIEFKVVCNNGTECIGTLT